MSRTAILISVFMAAALLARPAGAAPCAVLLDVSGSMAGFHDGKMDPREAPGQHYSQLLAGLQQICPNGYIFGDPDPRVKGSTSGPFLVAVSGPLAQIPSNNYTTRLAEAVNHWFADRPSEATAIIVTDNVADNSADSRSEQDDFTNAITQLAVKGLSMFPVRLPFSGYVFDPTRRVPKQPYGQPRALIVYVVHRGEEKNFDAIVSAVDSTVASASGKDGLGRPNYENISIRPLFAHSPPSITSDQIGTNDKTITATLSGNTITISPHPLDKTWTLTVGVTLRAPREWEAHSTVGATMSIDPTLNGYLTPLVLHPQVLPDTKVNFINGNPVPIRIVVPIGKMDYKTDVKLFPVLIKLLRGEGDFVTTGKLWINVAFKSNEIWLNPDVVRRWDYRGDETSLAEANYEVQSRIYDLEPIARRFVASSQDVLNQKTIDRPDTLKIVNNAMLPRWPLYGFIAAMLVLLGGLLAFLFIAGRRRDYEVVNDMGESRKVSLAFGNAAMLVSHDEKVRARARRFVLFFLVTSRYRVVRGRILRGDKGGPVQLAGSSAPGLIGAIAGAIGSLSSGNRRASSDDLHTPALDGHDQAYDFRIVAEVGESAQRAGNSEDPNSDL